MAITRTKSRRGRVLEQLARRPLLIGVSGVILGFAGLLFNLYQYVAGSLLLIIGGVISGVAERRKRRAVSTVGESLDTKSTDASDDEAAGSSIWSIPKPVRTFTGRSNELTWLRRQLSRSQTSAAVVALHGMPGLGKTQLAMAYAERFRANFEIGWWITASNRLWALAGLAELAHCLGLATEDQEQDLAAEAAVAALARRSDWLLIFDDVADQTTLTGLIPDGLGQVIITSRSPAWDALAITNAIPTLGERDAVKLLLAHSGDNDVSAAADLAEQLEGLPLAIAQAGTYCRFRAVTLSEYRKRFQAGVARLMGEGDARPYPVSVTVTVDLAVRQLLRKSVAAVQLLRILSFLGPEAVPRDLFAHRATMLPSELARAARDTLDLDRLVEMLVNTSLVSLDRPGFIRTHNLVQGIVRSTATASATSFAQRLKNLTRFLRDSSSRWTEKRWIDAVSDLLVRAFPGDLGDLRNWDRCVVMAPHLAMYIEHATRVKSDFRHLDAVSNVLAAYLHDRGEYPAARVHFERCLRLRQQAFGPRHPDLYGPMYQLAVIAYRLGQFIDSERLVRQLADSARQTLGPDHPETLNAEMQLSIVLSELGHLDTAKMIAERVHSVCLDAYGAEHPDTLRAEHALNCALVELTDDRNEVVKHFTFAVDRLSDEFGDTHFRALKARHNLHRVQAEAGDYSDAKRGYRKLVSIMSDTYGLKHPFSLYVLHNVARTYWLEGHDLEKARIGFEEVLVAREQVIGIDHPKTLTTRHYLARVLAAQGHRNAAEMHLRQVADARTRTLGADNPYTLQALDDIERLVTSGTTSRHGLNAVRRFRPDLASSVEVDTK
ncbi:tetratricopeptide repeat protein [Actinosynnema sp. NPDC004786]